jgi:hypothetical protein
LVEVLFKKEIRFILSISSAVIILEIAIFSCRTAERDRRFDVAVIKKSAGIGFKE